MKYIKFNVQCKTNPLVWSKPGNSSLKIRFLKDDYFPNFSQNFQLFPALLNLPHFSQVFQVFLIFLQLFQSFLILSQLFQMFQKISINFPNFSELPQIFQNFKNLFPTLPRTFVNFAQMLLNFPTA